jgi:putative FmdB family regulatory protein
MPIYEYEHTAAPCSRGDLFEEWQAIKDQPLQRCPCCAGPVRKVISASNISTPKSDTELRNLGFTKLVKREDGVYENVTARDGESRFMKRGQAETQPNLQKIIRD